MKNNKHNDKVFVRLIDLESKEESENVSLYDIIYNQDEIVFEFPDGTSLPYKDFLCFTEDYQVNVDIIVND